jgi:hypothetical protein
MGMVTSASLFFLGPRTFRESSGPTPIVISTAQKFLRTLYPDVTGKNYIMSVATFGTLDTDWILMPTFEVAIGPAEKGHMDWIGGRDGKAAQMVEQKPILTASFDFDKEGLLANAYVRSDTVTFSSENEHLRTIVDANPGWSDQQVTTALEAEGARFGPTQRNALLKAVPVKLLEPFIGALQIDSAEFRLRHPQPPHAIAELYWEVLGHSQIASGRNGQWDLIIEPFRGTLIALTRSE